jgi:hypothetical protein
MRVRLSALLSILILFLAGALASPSAKASVIKIRVLARVASRSITDRMVKIDILSEKPEYYGMEIPRSEMDQGLQRLISQTMILEEYRIIGSEETNPKDIDKNFLALKERFKERWKPFLQEFELNEKLFKEKISQKLLVQKALDERVKSALAGTEKLDEAQREQKARKALEDWLAQLRARYKVQIYRYDG